jgi:hypothetical protein
VATVKRLIIAAAVLSAASKSAFAEKQNKATTVTAIVTATAVTAVRPGRLLAPGFQRWRLASDTGAIGW